MATYSSQDVADTFKQYANYLRNEIEGFNRVDTLPTFGTKVELAARKKAANILIPVMKMFELGYQQYATEAVMAAEPTNEYPMESLFGGEGTD